MKIYVSHAKEQDFLNELYTPIRQSEINKAHDFFLPHEDGRQMNTKEALKDFDLVLAEVSFPATGQGIELGWANMLNVPILCVSKESKKISGSLKYLTNNFITYTDSQDLITKVSAFLSK